MSDVTVSRNLSSTHRRSRFNNIALLGASFALILQGHGAVYGAEVEQWSGTSLDHRIQTSASSDNNSQKNDKPFFRTAGGGRWGAPTPSGDRPKRRTSGGDRNPGPDPNACPIPLVAIVPGEGNVGLEAENCNATSLARPSQTSMRSPTVWFYMPSLDYSGLKGELVLLNEDQQLIHKSIHDLNQTGGFLPITFDYALKPNLSYGWQFSIILDPDHPTENLMVENTIEYQPNQTGLSTQDQLHRTAQQACLNPTDRASQQAWAGALESVNLSGIVSAPWISCQPPGNEMSRSL